MRPENTLPAFRYAIAQGVDALEMDMAVTKDNVVVVSHDPFLEQSVCTGAAGKALIRSLTLAQVREWDCGAVRNPRFPKQETVPGTRIPTLDEVFDLAPLGTFDFNIETKIFKEHPEYSPGPEEFLHLVLARIRAHNVENRVILQSFDFRTLVEMRRVAPEIRISALLEFEPADFLAAGREAKADMISPEVAMATPERVHAAHAAGLQVVPWTANEPKAWDKLIAAGVDAIISDDPAGLIAYLKARGRR
jgi:glycerophosphoryl diester phosphodiesterase